MVDEKYRQYVLWAFDHDLDAIAHEENMIKGSPDNHFKGGADEKQATLHALYLLETKLFERSWS